MKQPIWVFNASVFVLFAAFLTYIALHQVKLPAAHPISIIEPEGTGTEKTPAMVDTSRILTNDIFGTYRAKTPIQEQQDFVQPVPPPPSPIQVVPPPIEQPKFLDPLAFTLTGIIMLHDDGQNRAIIKENKSNAENTYKIGDEVDDAQLVKIFENKVLFIRSNGQQEWLYLNQDDATIDSSALNKKDWSSVVSALKPNTFLVDRQEFIEEARSLNDFIDLFALATAYQEGKSIGLKIGKIVPTGLAAALGLQPGDIIVSINNEQPITTEQRIKIYEKVCKLPENATIEIVLQRAGAPITISYIIGTVEPPPQPSAQESAAQPATASVNTEMVAQYKEKLLRQKEKFAPTLQELRLREKENVIKHQKALQKAQDGTNKG